MQEATNPFFKLVKKNEQIYLNIHPGMSIPDVAIGIYTLCELIAEQNRDEPEVIARKFNQLLTAIAEKTPKIKQSLEVGGE